MARRLNEVTKEAGNRFAGIDQGGGNGWLFPVGAVWFDARNPSIDWAPVKVDDTEVINSAVYFVSGQVSGMESNEGTGTLALQFNDPPRPPSPT